MIQVNSNMKDPVGPGKLVRHMQNPPYTYDGPSYVSVYAIALGTSFNMYKVKSAKDYAWLVFYYTCISLLRELPDGMN